MTPDVPFARAARRRADGSIFVPVVLVVAALALLMATLPFGGVRLPHVPGARRAQALLERIPYPGKPARPVYVAPPDAGDAALPLSVVQIAALPEPRAAAPVVVQPAAAPPAPPQPAAQPAPPVVQPAEPPPAAPEAAAPPAETPSPAAALPPPPPAARLEGFRHQWQTWNNCGPATITMATSHFGRPETQAQAAPVLKPNPNDKNVSPDELVAYVRSVGLQADLRVGGDLERLKQLLAAGIPVVVEMWFTPHPNDGMGHYRLLVGYSDAAGRFSAYDSFEAPGVNVALPYEPFDADWRVFNRTFIPVYPTEQADVVARIVGAEGDERAMWERALGMAQAEVAAAPNDAFAWFNVGTNLVALGRTAEAVPAFDRARALKLPWRMLWYQFAPFEAYLAEGRLGDVLALTAANLSQANDLEESHYYRGRAQQAQGQAPAARAEYQAALRANPKYAPASYALAVLG